MVSMLLQSTACVARLGVLDRQRMRNRLLVTCKRGFRKQRESETNDSETNDGESGRGLGWPFGQVFLRERSARSLLRTGTLSAPIKVL